MKILAVSDLHSSKPALKYLKNILFNNKYDLLIIPGDITIHEPNALEYLKSVEQILNEHNLPYVCVHGNNDPSEVIDYLRNQKKDVHFYPLKISDYQFMGIGGWGDELPPYVLNFTKPTIFITHIPPKINPGKPIPEYSPILHLSGHIHAWARFYDAGSTRIINVPSLMTARFAEITLPSREVQFKNIT